MPGRGLADAQVLSAERSVEQDFGVVPRTFALDRLSIELTNACDKACPFCYNHSQPEGDTLWSPDEVVALVEDCADHGVAAVSFGGGEPLQYPALFDILRRLDGRVFRSFTTSGLRLDEQLDGGSDTPSPKEMARVAESPRFQSMTCLLGCAASPRFASLDWARRVAWCSYTESRRELSSLDFRGVEFALTDLDLRFCG